MAYVNDVMTRVDLNNVGDGLGRNLIAEVDDLLIAINVYVPGTGVPFHYHKGSSQSYLCLSGELTLSTKETEDGEVTVHTLAPGQCAMIPDSQYYQIDNLGTEPVLLYQVKKPGDQVVVVGKGQMHNSDYFSRPRSER